MVSCAMLFACGVTVSRRTGSHWDVVWDGYNTIFTLITVMAMFWLSLNYKVNNTNWLTTLVKKISANTLGIYFIHMIIYHIMEKSEVLSAWSESAVTLIIKALIVLGTSLTITLLMKKVPLIRELVK